MKVANMLKVAAAGWAQKQKGFRVRFQTEGEDGRVTEFMPDMDTKPLESEVVTWRAAWKLAQATKSPNPEMDNKQMLNVTVVDEAGTPVRNYANNRYVMYNHHPEKEE
jgi:hypothetical protein